MYCCLLLYCCLLILYLYRFTVNKVVHYRFSCSAAANIVKTHSGYQRCCMRKAPINTARRRQQGASERRVTHHGNDKVAEIARSTFIYCRRGRQSLAASRRRRRRATPAARRGRSRTQSRPSARPPARLRALCQYRWSVDVREYIRVRTDSSDHTQSSTSPSFGLVSCNSCDVREQREQRKESMHKACIITMMIVMISVAVS